MSEEQLSGPPPPYSPRLASWIGIGVTVIASLMAIALIPNDLAAIVIAWAILAGFLGFRMTQRCTNCGRGLLQRRISLFGHRLWIFHPIVSKRCCECDARL